MYNITEEMKRLNENFSNKDKHVKECDNESNNLEEVYKITEEIRKLNENFSDTEYRV